MIKNTNTSRAYEQSNLPNGHSDLEVFYGLPKDIKYCSRCIISNQRPSSVVESKNQGGVKPTIEFDADNVCSACQFQDIKNNVINWENREEELEALLDKHRRSDGRHDCIVPGSGGKDSAYTSHILKYKYGMNPLTVTWAPHSYTEIGWKNFQSWVHSGLDNYLVTPNGEFHRFLTKKSFINLCHPFQPFILGQRQIAPRLSEQTGIPLIFYGENQAEYGNNIKENDKPTMDQSFFTSDAGLKDTFVGGESLARIIEEGGFRPSDAALYLPANTERIKNIGTEVHYLGYYLKWDPQEMYYYAAENTGFKPNTERTQGSYSKYSSIDDKIDPLHYYTTYVKFGLGRASYDAAQEVRTEKLDREEAVLLANKYDHEFPHKFFEEMLEYLDVDEDLFHAVCDAHRSPHMWKMTDGKWELRTKLK